MKKEKVRPGRKDLLRAIKEHFPGENSSVRKIIHQLIPGAVDRIELKIYTPCIDSPKMKYDQPGYTTFQIKLFKEQTEVAEQMGAIENKFLLKQLIEEFVYISGCGQKAINITVDCEPTVFPAYSIANLNKN